MYVREIFFRKDMHNSSLFSQYVYSYSNKKMKAMIITIYATARVNNISLDEK